ncbi:hypothetical protein EVAR_15067_1 [Eumeta japonica]|uniref:Uncharacterized protein n=1 Tax=Eumeta variegata TaxID=151549 RepID=A0A4C1YI99_EUMVA|nr:hypothetical protein EVAR_15067_1 [Eumeta japonica]
MHTDVVATDKMSVSRSLLPQSRVTTEVGRSNVLTYGRRFRRPSLAWHFQSWRHCWLVFRHRTKINYRLSSSKSSSVLLHPLECESGRQASNNHFQSTGRISSRFRHFAPRPYDSLYLNAESNQRQKTSTSRRPAFTRRLRRPIRHEAHPRSLIAGRTATATHRPGTHFFLSTANCHSPGKSPLDAEAGIGPRVRRRRAIFPLQRRRKKIYVNIVLLQFAFEIVSLLIRLHYCK